MVVACQDGIDTRGLWPASDKRRGTVMSWRNRTTAASTMPSTWSGFTAVQAQGRASSIVAKCRHTRLTTRTPMVARISAKSSATRPLAAASVMAGNGSLRLNGL
jgi:hypothetical protein